MMKYLIISENLESSKNLGELFDCPVFDMKTEIDYSDYDFVILIYNVNKGRCSYDVFDICKSLYNKHIALIGIGNTGFDVNNVLMRALKRNSNLVVYSEYCKNLKTEEVYNNIVNKIVKTDGKEFSEMFVGKLCRILFRKGW